MNTQEKYINQFIKKISRKLPTRDSKANNIIQNLRADAQLYYENNPSFTKEEFEREFGTVQDIISNINGESLQGPALRKAHQKKIIMTSILCCVLLLSLFIGIIIHAHITGIPTDIIETIEYLSIEEDTN